MDFGKPKRAVQECTSERTVFFKNFCDLEHAGLAASLRPGLVGGKPGKVVSRYCYAESLLTENIILAFTDISCLIH